MFPASSTSYCRMYQCETCNKAFAYKQAYDKHVLYHDVEKITSFNQVPVSDISHESFERHQVTQEERKMPVYSTPVMASSVSESEVKQVEVKLEQPETFNQPQTQQPLSNTKKSRPKPQSKATLHRAPHQQLKLFACDECDKSYTRKDHLSRHKLWHIGDRPHVCGTCHKSFIRKDKLIRHEKIHLREGNFVCQTCGKSFLRKDSLNKHCSSLHPHAFPKDLSKSDNEKPVNTSEAASQVSPAKKIKTEAKPTEFCENNSSVYAMNMSKSNTLKNKNGNEATSSSESEVPNYGITNPYMKPISTNNTVFPEHVPIHIETSSPQNLVSYPYNTAVLAGQTISVRNTMNLTL